MVDWSQVDTVLLDMDGTILDLHFDNFFWQQYIPEMYAKKNSVSIQTAYTVLEPMFTEQRGSLQWYCLDYWQDRLGLDIVGLKEDIAHLISYLPHAENFLRSVRLSGRKLILVTNAHQGSLQLKMKHTGLAEYFSQVHSAHNLGLAKEEVGFWSTFQAACPVNFRRVLFVDDNEAVLDNAIAEGLQQVIAVTLPDTKGGNKVFEHHKAVRHLGEVLPPVSA